MGHTKLRVAGKKDSKRIRRAGAADFSHSCSMTTSPASSSIPASALNKLVYFMAIEGAKFRQPVEPGVLLRLEVEFVQKRASVCKFAGRAMVDGKLAAEASFTAMIADPPAA